MARRLWLKASLIKASAQLIKIGASYSRDPAIQTRTWVSILASGKQPARTTAPVRVNSEARSISCPPTLLSKGSSHWRRPQKDTLPRCRHTKNQRGSCYRLIIIIIAILFRVLLIRKRFLHVNVLFSSLMKYWLQEFVKS